MVHRCHTHQCVCTESQDNGHVLFNLRSRYADRKVNALCAIYIVLTFIGAGVLNILDKTAMDKFDD